MEEVKRNPKGILISYKGELIEYDEVRYVIEKPLYYEIGYSIDKLKFVIKYMWKDISYIDERYSSKLKL